MSASKAIDKFIERWKPSGGSEMGNFQLFATELTELLDVERPKPVTSDGQNNGYRFERPVTFTHTASKKRGRIDLYRKGCFILEAKQGADNQAKADENQLALLTEQDAPKTQKGHGKRGSAKWDDTMLKARNQADGYARAVSKEDGWPPFLLVVDVGHVIELYADFSRQGQGYSQFPDGTRYRITLDDLANEDTRKLLQTIWDDPLSLDPALQTAKVTREIASHLAELGKSFEAQKHDSEKVARFLMRCLFTMFAEDVELIPKGSFTKTLHELHGHPEHAAPTLQALWETMDKGGFSSVLKTDLLRFNGGLFKEADALSLDKVQLSLLIEAAEADWKQVEPAIFGTLLERALDKKQRHKLGAHYTPRAYVERLVVPTIMEPLRSDWKDVQAAALTLAGQGQQDEAINTVRAFRDKLCSTRVLDPACGSGNFLYVAMEMMKRLEGEVSSLLEELGDDQLDTLTVNPEQFLGLELNEWAVAVAELVLWIGYLQWHFRTFGKATPSQPVLRDFANIKHCDAVLTWTGKPKPRMDKNGNPQTHWDGVSTIAHQVTGEEVPDPNARIQVYDYQSPKPTKWPDAEFIVGNPPFIGAKNMRGDLGDGYVEALWQAYPDISGSSDLVMYWWDKAASATQKFNAKSGKGVRRFGLITTNSIHQTFNRKTIQKYSTNQKHPISMLFTVPDHPWVDTQFGAAVRISMTVGALGDRKGEHLAIVEEKLADNESEGRSVAFKRTSGKIHPSLQIGPDLGSCKLLLANRDIGHKGFMPYGLAFWVSRNEAEFMGLGRRENAQQYIKPYVNGRDLNQQSRNRYVLDFHETSENFVRTNFPEAYQHLLENSKPIRAEDKMPYRRDYWWRFGQQSTQMRSALEGLSLFFATTETAAHRIFSTLDGSRAPDQKVRVIASSEWAHFAVLCSRIHVEFSFRKGGWQGKGNDPVYQHTNTFDQFPFPDLELVDDEKLKQLRSLGQELDQFRKDQIAADPTLTLTDIYNALEELRVTEAFPNIPISDKSTALYKSASIGILKHLHDQIDGLTFELYGWGDLKDALIGKPGATRPHQPKTETQKQAEETMLYRLVDLNHERSKEEAAGNIRWLRPEYQNPSGTIADGKTKDLDLGAAPLVVATTPWPKVLPDQIAAVREALDELGEASSAEVARKFKGAGEKRVIPLLESLVAIGQADLTEGGKYAL